jgi:hypothetical protein
VTEDAALNLMMEINGKWFYKKTGVISIDLIPGFFQKPLPGKTEIPLRIFAPPPDGVNDPAQGKDWEINYYTKMTNPPEMRIRYSPAAELPGGEGKKIQKTLDFLLKYPYIISVTREHY